MIATLLAVAVVVLVVVAVLLLRIERQLRAQPAAMTPDDIADLIATTARTVAQETAAAAPPSAFALGPAPAPSGTSQRTVVPRIKAAGWAAGASETVRRLRRGA